MKKSSRCAIESIEDVVAVQEDAAAVAAAASVAVRAGGALAGEHQEEVRLEVAAAIHVRLVREVAAINGSRALPALPSPPVPAPAREPRRHFELRESGSKDACGQARRNLLLLALAQRDALRHGAEHDPAVAPEQRERLLRIRGPLRREAGAGGAPQVTGTWSTTGRVLEHASCRRPAPRLAWRRQRHRGWRRRGGRLSRLSWSCRSGRREVAAQPAKPLHPWRARSAMNCRGG